MVTTTRIDSSISALGHNGPTSIKSPGLLSGVNHELNKPEGKTNQVSGLLSKNITASLALSDSHYELASIDIAKQAIKEVASSLFEIKKVIEPKVKQGITELSPEQSNNVLSQQRTISKAMQAQFADSLVLDSTLAPQIQSKNSIAFKIEGLDLSRSRKEDELVTLQLDGKLSLMMFEAGKSDAELLTQFNKALSFSDMSIEKNIDNELVLSMSDSQWRQSSKITNIIGQGHRFPSGQAIPTNISSVKGDISALSKVPLVADKQTLSSVNDFINEAKSSYQQLNALRKEEVKSSTPYLQQFQTESDPFEPKINTIISQKKWASLYNLKQNHATISRKTVVDLLK